MLSEEIKLAQKTTQSMILLYKGQGQAKLKTYNSKIYNQKAKRILKVGVYYSLNCTYLLYFTPTFMIYFTVIK